MFDIFCESELVMRKSERIPTPEGRIPESADESRHDGGQGATESAVESPPAAPQASAGAKVPNPFNPDLYRVSQDFTEIAVKKVLTTVPVCKPNKSWFFRVCPDAGYRGDFWLLEHEREVYFILPAIAEELGTLAVRKTIYTCKNRGGLLFLWPVKLPTAHRDLDKWNESAHRAAEIATTKWVSVRAGEVCYDVYEAAGALPEPDWLDKPPFIKLLGLAFDGKTIDDLDHPVCRTLRGLA
jgi:hypothetical protein